MIPQSTKNIFAFFGVTDFTQIGSTPAWATLCDRISTPVTSDYYSDDGMLAVIRFDGIAWYSFSDDLKWTCLRTCTKYKGAGVVADYTVPKHDGTQYQIKGTALTPVYHPEDDDRLRQFYPRDCSVIQLASGEKVIYVKARLVPHSNNYAFVGMLHRNAQDFTPQQVRDAIGGNTETRHCPICKALNIGQDELVE